MNKRDKILKIREIFETVYPDAGCSLEYTDPLQLLIATQLAAQCTDARVNIVTKDLYQKYPDVYAFAAADLSELEQDIRSTGFYHNKAKNIIGCCQMLIREYNGIVPNTMEDLLRLPGVGRKTANLVLGDIFHVPGMVIDTHAKRLLNRIGLTTFSDPTKIEFDLKDVVPAEYQTKFCHQLVLHGRAVCDARKPNCTACPIAHLCKFTSN